MTLPVRPPVAPMLAKLSRDLPRDAGLFYEPKWDGFRCIVYRDGDDVELGSRNEKPLTRYFPELVEALRRELPSRCVLDGEIVIAGPTGLDFDALSQRIHPAEKRIRLLAESTPASFVAFDLLAHNDRSYMDTPYAKRRAALEKLLAKARPPVHLTPVTDDPDVANDWFSRFEGAGLDGVVVKAGDLHYLPDKRAMVKVKHQRTADCVVAGFRTHKDGAGVGSLLLGLFDDEGTLHHVGVASGFSVARRRELVAELEPLPEGRAEGPPMGGVGRRASGGPGSGRHEPLERRQGHDMGAGARPNGCARCPTTTCRRTASATRRRSCAGAPTARRPRAPTASWTPRSPTSWRGSSGPSERRAGRRCARRAVDATARSPRQSLLPGTRRAVRGPAPQSCPP